MSTVTVVRKNGYAAIAADTQTTWGWEKETAKYLVNHHKIIQIGESYLAITGSTAGKLVLHHYFNGLEQAPDFSNVNAIFAAWLQLHEALKETYFLRPNEDDDDSFESSRLNILIANAHGIFSVEARRSVQEFSRFYAEGSGDNYAMGAMYALYDDESKSAEEIARAGVEAAAEFNIATGLPVISHQVKLLKSSTR